MKCFVCGNDQFSYSEVLWDELITEWQLSEYESEYINRQQGLTCNHCGSNLRSIALAKGILAPYNHMKTLQEFVNSPENDNLRVLEINPAGGLTPVLSSIKHHKLVSYPEYDMTNLAIESASYDLVVHSDTLEHVNNPVKALSECLRVLADDGRCVFTIPIIVDRLSRSRCGLAKSYHGRQETSEGDYIVHTEFGMDAWKYVLKAGFSQSIFHCLEYPAGLSIEAKA